MATGHYESGHRLLKLLRTDYHSQDEVSRGYMFLFCGTWNAWMLGYNVSACGIFAAGSNVFRTSSYHNYAEFVGCRTDYHNRDALYASIIDTCTGCGWDAPLRMCGIFENEDQPLFDTYSRIGCLSYLNRLSWLLLSASSITDNRCRHQLCFE